MKKSSFHLNYEKHIYNLTLSIQNRTYHPEKSSIFVVSHPKPREIIAAHIRDRIVHHFIYDYMGPTWERRFAPNSYACRPGMGPLHAVKEFRRVVSDHYRAEGAPLYCLKVDIQSFFPSVDLNILYEIICRTLTNPLYLWLSKVVIFHRATDEDNYILRSPEAKWASIPRYKSLFFAERHKGLPIGNLTSQFYANIYMNELDQFIRHRISPKVLYWQRYVDDVCFLATDPQVLRDIVPELERFLNDNLALKLNPKKTIIQPLSRGVDQLGFFLKPDHALVRQSVANVAKKKARKFINKPPDEQNVAKVCATMNSYFGHFGQGNGRRLRRSLAGEILKSRRLGKRLTGDDGFTKLAPKCDLQAMKKAADNERALIREFESAFVDTAMGKSRKRMYSRSWHPIGDLLAAAQALHQQR